MKTATVSTILLLTLVSFTNAGSFDNPVCQETPRNTDVPTGGVLFIFMIGFGDKDETQKVFYALKQTTCWLPTVAGASAAVFPAGHATIDIQDSQHFNETRNSLKKFADSNHQRDLGTFQKDIETLKTLNSTFKGFEKIIIIAQQRKVDFFISYYDLFLNSQFDARFTFSLIRMNAANMIYPSLNIDSIGQMNLDEAIASDKLRLATRSFMDDILGRPRTTDPLPSLTTPTPPKEEEEFPWIYVIIGGVVVVILVILAIVGLTLFCICRKRKKNKKEKKSNGDCEKQKSKKPTGKSTEPVSGASPQSPGLMKEKKKKSTLSESSSRKSKTQQDHKTASKKT
ncbi:unnamed protein product [Caenorhabditis angaria]|uniref:Glucuronosyltransferase n=1 Tax=Caenorhabditis angaria TaxID=860376 RepID=A0A9P1MXF1_9PELO|nr:unnamed protein product [Caenorhabditis angaria]